jgi:hypothetical protein
MQDNFQKSQSTSNQVETETAEQSAAAASDSLVHGDPEVTLSGDGGGTLAVESVEPVEGDPDKKTVRIDPEHYQRPADHEFEKFHVGDFVLLKWHSDTERGQFPARILGVQFGDGVVLNLERVGFVSASDGLDSETVQIEGTELSVLSAQWVERPARFMIVVHPEECYTDRVPTLETDEIYAIAYENQLFAGRIAKIQFEESVKLFIEPEFER